MLCSSLPVVARLIALFYFLSAVVNTVTNKVARMLGKDETIRFLNLALFQGLPIKQGFTTLVESSPSCILAPTI